MKTRARLNLTACAFLFSVLLCHQLAHAGQALRFTDRGNGIIEDQEKGLMWQKATAPGTYTWDEALSYCANLSLGGFSDWRLPELIELFSLVDRSISPPGPIINTTYFPLTRSGHYWTATRMAPDANFIYYVDFGRLNVYDGHYKDFKYYVRAVRGGK
jgi:hypothetical protein